MSAEALISTLLEQLAKMVLNKVGKEVRLVSGVKKEVEKLQTTLKSIEAVLEDADQKQMNDKSVKLWLDDLKDVGYDMEDLLEEWIIEMQGVVATSSLSLRQSTKEKVLSALSSPFTCFKSVGFRHEIAHKIVDIRERIGFIEEEKKKFQLIQSDGSKGDDGEDLLVSGKKVRDMTTSVVDENAIFGRNFDKDVIKSKLLMVSESSIQEEMKVSIIAVVGMGGLGKTTLAQLIYNDNEVCNHFEMTMWVCVSDPFDKVRLAKEIIRKSNLPVRDAIHSSEWNDDLHRQLCNAVKDKHFLLVLDVVWTEDFFQWEPLKTSLELGARGSQIMITTRNEGVAVMMNASYIHRIGQLPEHDSWLLFSRIAFSGRTAAERGQLEEMGKELVKKCEGVPLSIKAIAGLVHKKRSRGDWQRVLESDVWKEPEVEGKILPALLLSYYALPSNLKRCFAYCAVFRKDARIRKEELVKQWIAHGFVVSKGGKELENTGEEYFDDLVMRSFFQDVKMDRFEYIITCKMHDLIHDLAQSLTQSEITVLETGFIDQLGRNRVRHLTIPYTKGKNSALLTISDAKKLRSLKMNSEFTREVFDINIIFHHLRFLRVLDLEVRNLKELPGDVENLKHLRYFKLVGRNLIKIPETICNLCNLQTFLLIGGSDLLELPKGIGKMTSLRHLEFDHCWHLNSLFSVFVQSSSLHKLDDCIINNVNGGSEHEHWWSSRLKNGLKDKANLKVAGGDVRIAFPKLKELRIVGILSLEDWRSVANTIDLMPRLRKLYLRRCNKALSFPPFGKLKSLQVLEIDGNMSMESIGPEFLGISYGVGGKDSASATSFPRLEYLRLENMEKVERWSFPVEQDPNSVMPHLRELVVAHCQMLRVLPALGILKSLEKVELNSLDLVQHLGMEFMGLSKDEDLTNGVGSIKPFPTSKTLFPCLTSLTLRRLIWLGKWEFPSEEDVEIMPCLHELLIFECLTVRELPPLGRLKSLESLVLSKLYSIKHVGLQFWGVHTGKKNKSDEGESISIVAFPMLRQLEFCDLPMWEEWNLLPRPRRRIRKRNVIDVVEREDISIIMPCLEHLLIASCPRLEEIPLYISSGTSWKLEIKKCYGLRIGNIEGMVNLQELEVDGESIDLMD